ncbi:MAG TPA: hypothetical protein DEA46_00705, partial [Candidatus Moranbacteria bacterium]|nr:hypothetical protein [Candidatus Moranbacteria bacterium]
GKRNGKLCNKEIILGQFGSSRDLASGAFEAKSHEEYQDFMDRSGEYFKDKKEELKGYLLE